MPGSSSCRDQRLGTPLPWRLFYAAGTGVLAGVVLGVLVALAIGRGRRPLRERDEIADSIGVPIMASVRVSRPAKPSGWTKLLDGYAPEAADAWRLRNVLRELGHLDLAGGDGSSVAVLSLARDRKALALGPQLAAFAAQQGIPATLVLDSRQDAKVTAALRAACVAAPGRGGRTAGCRCDGSRRWLAADRAGRRRLRRRRPGAPGRHHRARHHDGARSHVRRVTAQQLARVAASAAGDGRTSPGSWWRTRTPATRRPVGCPSWPGPGNTECRSA